jgi:hypothetical protein
MWDKQKLFAVALIFLIALIASASTYNFAKATTAYTYTIMGPYYMNMDRANGNTVSCNLVWANFTTTTLSLTTTGGVQGMTSIYSNVLLYQITWNASSALNYTSLIDFNGFTPIGATTIQEVLLTIPDPSLPFALYTFQVADFAGMGSAYLSVVLNNGTSGGVSVSWVSQQVSLESVGMPTFVLTQYYTYTLIFTCDKGTYSQQFTAENTLQNSLIVLAGAFPTTDVTIPTTTVARLNSTLIGITYQAPSLGDLTILITHKSGIETIVDYTLDSMTNSHTTLWNLANPNISYNVNVTAIVGGTTYVWILVASEQPKTNPFSGVFDFLGQNVATLPHVQTGWPEGMTSAQIGEIIGATIVMLFLCIGSFRSAGACCLLSWIIFGILLYLGWLGAITPWVSAEFAFSGFVGILIMIDEGKQTTRET